MRWQAQHDEVRRRANAGRLVVSPLGRPMRSRAARGARPTATQLVRTGLSASGTLPPPRKRSPSPEMAGFAPSRAERAVAGPAGAAASGRRGGRRTPRQLRSPRQSEVRGAASPGSRPGPAGRQSPAAGRAGGAGRALRSPSGEGSWEGLPGASMTASQLVAASVAAAAASPDGGGSVGLEGFSSSLAASGSVRGWVGASGAPRPEATPGAHRADVPRRRPMHGRPTGEQSPMGRGAPAAAAAGRGRAGAAARARRGSATAAGVTGSAAARGGGGDAAAAPAAAAFTAGGDDDDGTGVVASAASLYAAAAAGRGADLSPLAITATLGARLRERALADAGTLQGDAEGVTVARQAGAAEGRSLRASLRSRGGAADRTGARPRPAGSVGGALRTSGAPGDRTSIRQVLVRDRLAAGKGGLLESQWLAKAVGDERPLGPGEYYRPVDYVRKSAWRKPAHEAAMDPPAPRRSGRRRRTPAPAGQPVKRAPPPRTPSRRPARPLL